MKIEGKRIKRTRLIRGGRYVVAVEVEMVYPTDDSSEPCYEADTVEFLKQVEQHCQTEDVAWLKQHGTVYEQLSAA